MNRIIGVTPLYDKERDSYWMLPGYMKMLEAEGAVPLMLPLTAGPHILDYFLDTCGGFLFTGGQDVSPAVYGAEAQPWCGECCPARDEMEAYLLKKIVERDLPAFGICRGLQFMNVCLGGTLYQDLPTEHPSAVDHHMAPPYHRAAHPVSVTPGTPLFELLGQQQIGVNSCHHQAVRDLSPALRAAAWSDDGLVEAAWMPGRRFIAAVQWHPEFNYKRDQNSRRLVRAFVASVQPHA